MWRANSIEKAAFAGPDGPERPMFIQKTAAPGAAAGTGVAATGPGSHRGP